MKIVIVSGGTPPSYELLKKELKNSDYLICADSGGNCLYKYNIVPDYIMGDFDSIDSDAFDFFSKDKNCSIERFSKYKDCTDTELVLNKAIEIGGREIVLLGCTGSRIDHLMGNIGMLLKCLKLGIKASIKDNYNSIYITDKPIKIKGIKGEVFSLQAYSDCVSSLNISGARYKLVDYNLTLGDPRTVSNEFLDDYVEINFKSGILLIFYSKD
ncbi:thiamine diphosphokinase [Clostridium sp. A1-XYC3]|uniref:Thiamine diphosphokinase n=1 Tax=Clostridium tanneri TaxID=3037988 RepID=A0ABU4JSE2_9CLOT|nr:thiamine diphosphokinase [Clostridium sp. A1-XYC3]MDW8801077.1 thiamine diphosphokinase [Clostridium sp. A1-XYC3]